MREMKDSGIEWIGGIPKNNNLIRNKYFINYVKGKIPNNTNEECIGKPYIGASDLENGCYSIYTTDDLPQCSKDDTLILWDGARAGLIGTGHEGIISSTVVNVLPNNRCIDKNFWYWYIKGFEWFLISKVSGTTIPHMNRKYIEELNFIDFSIDEQIKIANFLDDKCNKIDQMIAKEQEEIEKLKEYKQSIITEVVTKGLDSNSKMKESGIEWMKKIPNHWNIVKLKNATKILRGKFNHRPRNDPKYYDGNYPFVQTGDVAKANKYIESFNQTLNDLGYSVSKEFPKGSICMTIAANVGDTAILNFDACFPDSVVGFVPTGILDRTYLYYSLKSMKEHLLRNAIISTQLNLNVEILKDEYIMIPPIEEQYDIVKQLDKTHKKIDDLIISRQNILDKMIEYKKSLIYECVTGKKEVF